MKWGVRSALMLVACGVVWAITLFVGREREPVYHNRSLRYWINLYETNPNRSDEAQRAIREIGMNALPTLLGWIRYEEPAWRGRLVDRLDTHGRGSAVLHRLAMGRAGWRARAAITGFEALGTAAYPGIVELAGLLGARSPFVSQNAMYALANLPGQKVLILAEGLTNRDSTVRLRVADYMGHFASLGSKFSEMDADPGVPLLLRSLCDEDRQVAAAAARSLGRIGLKSALVIPALTTRLADPSAVVRCAAAEALGSFGKQGECAVGNLERALRDESPAVRVAATNALRAIEAGGLGGGHGG